MSALLCDSASKEVKSTFSQISSSITSNFKLFLRELGCLAAFADVLVNPQKEPPLNPIISIIIFFFNSNFEYRILIIFLFGCFINRVKKKFNYK